MIKHVVTIMALLALGACAYQTEAQINAGLARHVGQSETDLVRDMGVPTRQFDSGGHRFLAYVTGHQEIDSPYGGGFGWGGGYGGWGGGYGGWGGYGGLGGWGWGGWGGGPGWGYPSEIRNYGCETTFEVNGGRVIGYKRHGNAC